MRTTKPLDTSFPPRQSVSIGDALGPITRGLFLFCVLLFPAGAAEGHEFEDGFIERSVAVVVRDNIARLEYSLGLNPNTRQQLIEFWQSSDRKESSVNEQIETEADATSSEQEAVDFFQLAAKHLRRRLEIRVNDHRVIPKIISALGSPRHHVDVTVTLEFDLPPAEPLVPTPIEIADRNFLRAPTNNAVTEKNDTEVRLKEKPKPAPLKQIRPLPAPWGGGFRYAFKTAGSTVLSSSNVASILIRADRHLDADLTAAQLDTALKMKAVVANIQPTPAKQTR